MLRILQRRLPRIAVVLVLVTLATTAMLDLVPGSPAMALAGENASPERIAEVEEELGLNDPLLVRYVSWLGDAVRGDLGESYRTGEQVVDAIGRRLPVTLQIGILAMVVALGAAVPLALVSAYRPNSRFDRAVSWFTSASLALPAFVIGLLLVYLFSVQAGWFPVTGWVPLTENPLGNLRAAALPSLSLAMPMMAVYVRVLRADVVTVLQEDFILLARSKGVPTWLLLLRHALRPASFTLVTVVGIRLGQLVGGTVVVETVFALPGMGQLFVGGVLNSDLILVQAIVAVIAVGFLAINLLVDLSYPLLDPRVRS